MIEIVGKAMRSGKSEKIRLLILLLCILLSGTCPALGAKDSDLAVVEGVITLAEPDGTVVIQEPDGPSVLVYVRSDTKIYSDEPGEGTVHLKAGDKVSVTYIPVSRSAVEIHTGR